MEFVRSSSKKLDSLKSTIDNFAKGDLEAIPEEHKKFVDLILRLKKRKINIDWELVSVFFVEMSLKRKCEIVNCPKKKRVKNCMKPLCTER